MNSRMFPNDGCGDSSGSIGRLVIDDNQLPLAPQLEPRLRLAHQGGETGWQRSLFVPGRNDDGKVQSGASVVLSSTFGHKFVL